MSVRKFQVGDEKGIVALLDYVFNGWPKIDLIHSKVDYWKWLFVDNPCQINNNIVAVKNDEIIGTNLGYFKGLRVNEKKYSSCLSGGLAVHPDHRGRGLYTKMRTLKHERHNELGTDFTMSITVNPQVIASITKRGHKPFPFELQKMSKIKDVQKHMSHVNSTISRSLLFTAKKMYSSLKYDSGDSKISVQIVDGLFEKEINNFWSRVQRNHRFIIDRDKKNLDWRFRDARGGNYTILVAREMDKIVGYIAVLVNRIYPDYPVGYVVDLLADKNRLDVVEALIKESEIVFDASNVNVVHFISVKDHPYQNVLLKKGFFKINFSQFVEFYPRNEVSKRVFFSNALPEQVHFQYGDLDLF